MLIESEVDDDVDSNLVAQSRVHYDGVDLVVIVVDLEFVSEVQ